MRTDLACPVAVSREAGSCIGYIARGDIEEVFNASMESYGVAEVAGGAAVEAGRSNELPDSIGVRS